MNTVVIRMLFSERWEQYSAFYGQFRLFASQVGVYQLSTSYLTSYLPSLNGCEVGIKFKFENSKFKIQ